MEYTAAVRADQAQNWDERALSRLSAEDRSIVIEELIDDMFADINLDAAGDEPATSSDKVNSADQSEAVISSDKVNFDPYDPGPDPLSDKVNLPVSAPRSNSDKVNSGLLALDDRDQKSIEYLRLMRLLSHRGETSPSYVSYQASLSYPPSHIHIKNEAARETLVTPFISKANRLLETYGYRLLDWDVVGGRARAYACSQDLQHPKAFSLNFSSREEAKARRDPAWITKRISHHLRNEFGRDVPFWFAVEISPKYKLHIHGIVDIEEDPGLEPDDDLFDGKHRNHRNTRLVRALKAVGGRNYDGEGYQVVIKDPTGDPRGIEGWIDYTFKDVQTHVAASRK